LQYASMEEQQVENYRKMFLAMGKDIRVILIKLADRLHNMRTLEHKSKFKQQENALETMEIFIPLAYYIGAYRVKSELEDLSFRYLKYDEYKRLEEEMTKASIENNNCLNEMLLTINEILNSEHIPHEIKIRTKNIYGIYKRLSEGHKMSDIHDLLSLKIMVDDIKNCYITLGLIHSKYRPINKKFKDYISNPKTNLYSSLHTTVFGPHEKLVQTQIRTTEMDRVASFGLATYWDINKGQARYIMQEDLRNKFQFFKSLTDINTMFADNQDFVSQVKKELFSDKIYVYTTNGNIVELPKGSNIIDLACHMGVKNIPIGAKVNEQEVQLEHILKNMDRVIITPENLPIEYKEDLIQKANTNYAKKKILELCKKNI